MKEDPVVKLNKLRSQIMSTIEINKIKTEKAEKDIQDLDAKIKQGENDIKQNQYSYSDQEKKAKVQKLMSLQKDRLRAETNLNKLNAYTEALKTNLSAVESKIEEIRNNQQFREGNEIMNQIGDLDTGDILQQNIQNMMRQQQEDIQNLRLLENGNNAINSGLGINPVIREVNGYYTIQAGAFSNYDSAKNQYVENDGNYDNRYDVSVLVNGLPLVHIELKRRGVALKEAFNQINRYQRDSFWAGSGLYEYVQIFVISNGTNTKYYSNTTRESHIKEQVSSKSKSKKTSNSFEFTSYWADATNKPINDLVDFTRTFFSKHTLLNILTKYCVFTSEELLLVMRPYQIVATERILNKIEVSSNYKMMGTLDAGGYIWHTTGSGKTLTSFKTAQLASKLDYIDKVLFVVDRKDLDYQTMREYDRFEKGAANGNRSTKILQKQLEDNTSRIIVTTIQKLTEFVKRNPNNPVFNKHMVLIFDVF